MTELPLGAQTKTTFPRPLFADGPWNLEPDKISWVDLETDLDCLIVRNRLGNLCGYVGVTKEHPFFGKSYHDVDEDIYVHGGLTFSDSCDEDNPEGICHVPLDGRDGDVWWLGFDCGHYTDLTPVFLAEPYTGLDIMADGTYRTVEYVVTEVTNLAKQLKKAA